MPDNETNLFAGVLSMIDDNTGPEDSSVSPARRKAEKLFTSLEERTERVKAIVSQENAERDAKTAKLRALRLAKEKQARELLGQL
jgi:hypothetical protein